MRATWMQALSCTFASMDRECSPVCDSGSRGSHVLDLPTGACYLHPMPYTNLTAEFLSGCAFGALAVAVVWFVWTI